MTNKMQILRSTTAALRPTGQPAGTLYWNEPDQRLGITTIAGTNIDLGWPEVPADGKSYARHRKVGVLGTWKEVAALRTFDDLTLNMQTGGSVNPASSTESENWKGVNKSNRVQFGKTRTWNVSARYSF